MQREASAKTTTAGADVRVAEVRKDKEQISHKSLQIREGSTDRKYRGLLREGSTDHLQILEGVNFWDDPYISFRPLFRTTGSEPTQGWQLKDSTGQP